MAIESQFCAENIGFPVYDSLDWMAESECGSGFRLDHLPQIQQVLQNQCPWSQSQSSATNFFLPSLKSNQLTYSNPNRNLFMDVSFSITAQVEKQSQEIDRHIRLQNVRLKMAVQEEMKQRLAVIVNKLESETRVLLSQKDEEMAVALRRRMDLEEFLKKLEEENQIRQREARENEAMVIALKNTLLQKKYRATSNPTMNGANDAESCCDSNREENERRVRVEVEEERQLAKMTCRSCHYRTSRIVFLPCRHLCLCKHCETVVEVCPVCETPKKASIEALM